jgi:hypothetical protein
LGFGKGFVIIHTIGGLGVELLSQYKHTKKIL